VIGALRDNPVGQAELQGSGRINIRQSETSAAAATKLAILKELEALIVTQSE
jgi:hypothetical protein